MTFDEHWNHGWRLVLRRVYELFVGPSPSLHMHHDAALWQFGLSPFVKWQRPVTDSAFHFDRLGVDFFFGPWTLCAHWIDH